MKIHKNLYISGKVQGVFYRKSTKEIADKLGVKGFVQNMPDGSVYAEAEGEEADISKFIAWCHIGPAAAKVTEIKVENADVVDFNEFIIWR
ncbi:MAG: acylphosphatase [Weeksellaceae bacterium]|nr:acylphosphatase [Weeksellaceae bacterium]